MAPKRPRSRPLPRDAVGRISANELRRANDSLDLDKQARSVLTDLDPLDGSQDPRIQEFSFANDGSQLTKNGLIILNSEFKVP